MPPKKTNEAPASEIETTESVVPVSESEVLLRQKDNAIAKQAAELEEMRKDIKILMQVVDPRQLSRLRPNQAVEGTEVRVTVFRKDINSPEQPLRSWRTLTNDVITDTDNHKIDEKQTIEIIDWEEKAYKISLTAFGKLQKEIATVKKTSTDPLTGLVTYTLDWRGNEFELGLPFLN